MRKSSVLLIAALWISCVSAGGAGAGVLLSELCDPQTNYTTDRFIEVYNPGPDAVDLTNWSVIAVGNNVEVATWNLSGTLAAGQAKVCGSTTATAFTVHFQSAVWATPAGYMNWNGKVGDGARLKNGSGILVDEVVAPGVLFENADLVRNPDVTDPNVTYTASEWTATPVSLVTDASPGTHNGSVPPPAGPAISNIVTVPLIPPAVTPVHVQAGVVDTVGAIAAVTLTWGPTSASFPDTITMSLLSDSTFQTDTQIPGQTAGASVYYKVQADGASGTNISSIHSYTIAGTSGAPTVLAVGQLSDSTFLVTFSEPVEETTAEVATNYTVGVLTSTLAVRDPVETDEVLIQINDVPAGPRTLTVNGVEDLDGNPTSGATQNFAYVDVSIPPGYYDGTAGLYGSALRVALHNIIKNHSSQSYGYALTAFATTDLKPTGKIWDMYSDVPGGTPPYEYSLGETGQGGTEGLGYNREHSWPQSWFNGASPMYSDLWILYPTDSYVNGYRGNYPYGEVGSATTTSLNGSKVGPNVSPGYSGTVFEPIDAYKGDLARGQFYVATRYFNEDAGWAGGGSAAGAEIYPWAVQLYMQWANTDSVSWKERLRNGAVYVIQNNRNPFVDHPEFVSMIYDSTAVVGVEPMLARTLQLRPNVPNPFRARTTLGFDLPRAEHVSLSIFDVTGRRVRTLAHGRLLASGSHSFEWNGRDESGTLLGAGLYFARLDAGSVSETRRIVFAR